MAKVWLREEVFEAALPLVSRSGRYDDAMHIYTYALSHEYTMGSGVHGTMIEKAQYVYIHTHGMDAHPIHPITDYCYHEST